MSLRDYFAGHALAGMVVGGWESETITQAEVDYVAAAVFRFADALIVSRTKKEPTP